MNTLSKLSATSEKSEPVKIPGWKKQTKGGFEVILGPYVSPLDPEVKMGVVKVSDTDAKLVAWSVTGETMSGIDTSFSLMPDVPEPVTIWAAIDEKSGLIVHDPLKPELIERFLGKYLQISIIEKDNIKQ